MSDQINYRRHGSLGTTPITFTTAELGSIETTDAPTTSDAAIEGNIPSLDGATVWLNSQPLQATDLRGKVVLIDFCTYTCINWLRTLPYIRAWAEKYRDQGLVVIGVHTPEFSFEHDIENVRRAVKAMLVEYPLAIDNEYAIWEAFNNHYWPALYLFDAEGQIRHHHFGEGDYDRSEIMIQRLLTETGIGDISVGEDLVSVSPEGIETAADWDNQETPETYLGYERTERFASPGGMVWGNRHVYEVPERLRRNQWALSGDWTAGLQAAALNAAKGRISYRFHARDLYLVMGPAARGTPVPFRVFLDGAAPDTAHGGDIDDQGNGIVTEQRLYQLIRQPGPITDLLFEIEFLDAGVEAYAFTFG